MNVQCPTLLLLPKILFIYLFQTQIKDFIHNSLSYICSVVTVAPTIHINEAHQKDIPFLIFSGSLIVYIMLHPPEDVFFLPIAILIRPLKWHCVAWIRLPDNIRGGIWTHTFWWTAIYIIVINKIIMCNRYWYSIPYVYLQSYIFRLKRAPFDEVFYQCVTYGAYSSQWQEQVYSSLSVLLMFIIPLVTMVTAYMLIFCTISRKSRDFQASKYTIWYMHKLHK